MESARLGEYEIRIGDVFLFRRIHVMRKPERIKPRIQNHADYLFHLHHVDIISDIRIHIG